MLKLNADLGEGFGEVDRTLMPFIDQANIACGGHAGDNDSIAQTVELAVKRGAAIGAHPSYEDREHFGRRSLDIELPTLEQQLFTQIQRVSDACTQAGSSLKHLKAHGGLYNDSNRSPELMHLLLRLAKAFSCELMVQSLPNMNNTLKDAKQLGVGLILEGFADRAYLSSGLLAPRSTDGAVYSSVEQIFEQGLKFAEHRSIACVDNQNELKIKIDSLCVHGDNQVALQALNKLYDALH